MANFGRVVGWGQKGRELCVRILGERRCGISLFENYRLVEGRNVLVGVAIANTPATQHNICTSLHHSNNQMPVQISIRPFQHIEFDKVAPAFTERRQLCSMQLFNVCGIGRSRERTNCSVNNAYIPTFTSGIAISHKTDTTSYLISSLPS